MKILKDILSNSKKMMIAGAGSLAMLLAGCATTIHGYVDASYVPVRRNERTYQNEIRTDVNVHTETPAGRNKVEIGGDLITYMNLADMNVISNLGGLFNPTNQDYQVYFSFAMPLDKATLDFYVFHDCFHPIGRSYISFSINSLDGGMNEITSQGETRVGVRLEY